jgi:hypothetical protein
VADIVEQHLGGAIPPRPSHGEAIDRVITALEDHGPLALSADKGSPRRELNKALQALADTYGMPSDLTD